MFEQFYLWLYDLIFYLYLSCLNFSVTYCISVVKYLYITVNCLYLY